jgi:hypothetical protein
MPQKRINVGGTAGGLGEFLAGLGLVIIGLYMVFTNTVVYTSFWELYGYNLLGPLMVLFLVGLLALGINARSCIGWILCSGAILAMAVGILMNLKFHFKNMTLLSALVIFGLPAVGLGLILRALREHPVAMEEE